ncbi:hypothetical protein HBN50_03850 [Halobacteriovorax sp. GB3]|uniref:hypothetical protein n=1 Tax=Halobacteriovorax sp. GB3 TaxID=2719615 RepID=UPI0023609ACB|nr:hypothetical protein [Halobacteriovorax sp. GB3]MDD0852213.1 hypothetical protein [Halobacteriovorax sp. GB3]
MRLSRALQDKIMDLRLRDKLVAEGKLSKAQVDEYLTALNDETTNAVFTDEVSKKSTSDED